MIVTCLFMRVSYYRWSKTQEAMPDSNPNEAKLDKILRVALTPQQKRELRIEAARRGKSMSETTRDVLFGDGKPVVE